MTVISLEIERPKRNKKVKQPKSQYYEIEVLYYGSPDIDHDYDIYAFANLSVEMIQYKGMKPFQFNKLRWRSQAKILDTLLLLIEEREGACG